MKKRKTRGILFLVFILTAGYISIPLPDPVFIQDYSTVIKDRNGKILRVFLNEKDQWIFPHNSKLEIPDKLMTSVMMYEDRYFLYHPGVNLISVFRSLYQNISSGRIVSGASTLSMQVCRLAQPKSRNIINKSLEMLQTLKLEINFSKKEIMTLYLDHAPYGGNIQGYQAASYLYFGKEPGQLTWAEAAMLAVLPNAPSLISPTKNPDILQKKKDDLLAKLWKEKIIDEETYYLSQHERIPNGIKHFPLLAPHFTQNLHNEKNSHSQVITSSLDLNIQTAVENLTKNHLTYLANYGIYNGAVLVMDNSTNKIRAYVGSQDYFDEDHQGQVDGVLSYRSSGSILKPFLYALSMDAGIILPKTKIHDIPTYFGTYAPVNADNNFAGMISAEDALINSLNVPAVRLLNAYGIKPFYRFLKQAGMANLFRQPNDYGLPLILGGAEVSLWELVKMYSGLISGKYNARIYITEDPEVTEQQTYRKDLISKGAAFLTLEILKQLKRPGSEFYWEQYHDQWPLAWKTGTSYGGRDAWAVGANREWTMAVWIGNFDGTSNPEIGGAKRAGPLLFEIFNFLPKRPEFHWLEKPEMHLEYVKICAETGFLASSACPETAEAEAPLNYKSIPVCKYHQRVQIDDRSGNIVCSQCWEDHSHSPRSILVYPPDVMQYIRENGKWTETLPAHNPDCLYTNARDVLKISYPHRNISIWVPKDVDGQYQRITLRSAHQQTDSKIFWYLDEVFIGETIDQHALAVQLASGKHKLEVVDSWGRRDKVTFYVARN